jgi:predicted DNA-binding transcriptional regulator YafY
MKIDRMLAITILLLSRDRVSAKELADRFEVTTRTIYRDIDAINLAGIPIVSYQGKEGGFGILDGFKLDRQIFTIKDMVSILSPLEGINNALKSESITKVIDKIHSLIPGNSKDYVTSSLNRMLIDIHPWGSSGEWKEQFKKLQNSIENLRVIKISYVAGNGKESIRKMEPMTLIFKSYTWYLWGYCLERADYRMFKLSRIRSLEVTNVIFSHRGESYKEPDEYKLGVVDITLKITANFLNRAIEYFEYSNIVKVNDGYIINLAFPPGEWIKEYIFSFGSNVQVIEPLWLKEEIIKEAKNILNMT